MSKKAKMDSSGFVDNWQGRKTLAECNMRMLEKEDCCDVSFRVGCEDHVIRAHRYVLISRSCVFYSMFVGELAERSEVILPDIEPQDFMKFLQYIYTDDTTIDPDNVTALLYASRKYAVSGLETRCLHVLEEHLTADNACVILEAAHKFDQKELFQRAMDFIKVHGDAILQSSGFLALSQVLVDQIIECDDFVADEHMVFTAVNTWAEAECGRRGREVTPGTKRAVLGDTLMKVRFPLLEIPFIVKEVRSSGLLLDPERLKLLDYRVEPDIDITPFISTKRGTKSNLVIMPVPSECRFKRRLTRLMQWSTEAISFRCSDRIRLHGFKAYGFDMDTDSLSVLVYSAKDTVVPCKVNDILCNSVDDVDVLFMKPITITRNTLYTLVVDIEGTPQHVYYGCDGTKNITCKDGVTFRFYNSPKSHNTSVAQGQIPALIYSVLS